ncbi:50S ribosomal protein L21 [Patescibacteria group bacterium]|nr:MAG: 50S ribosomal protein L21 [Patescibacteria group bacterium]
MPRELTTNLPRRQAGDKRLATKKIKESKARGINKDSGFAVIATGGKQYLVSAGNKIRIEKIKGGLKEGDSLTFDKVLLRDNGKETVVGDPYISDARVDAKLLKIGRAKKINVVHYKAKSRYYKKYGHRQPFFEVEITEIF